MSIRNVVGIFLCVLCFCAPRIMAGDDKPLAWHDLRLNLEKYEDKKVVVWFDMEVNSNAYIPDEIRDRYKDSHIFTNHLSRNPCYIAIDKDKYKKRLGSAEAGERLLFSGKLKDYKVTKRGHRVWVLDASDVKRYFPLHDMSEEEKKIVEKNGPAIDKEKYRKITPEELSVLPEKSFGTQVKIETDNYRLGVPLQRSMLIMGLQGTQWNEIVPSRSARVSFFMPRTREDNLLVARKLENKSAVFFGRVVPLVGSFGETTGLYVEVVEEKTSEGDKTAEKLEAFDPAACTEVLARDLITKATELDGKNITLKHVYEGTINYWVRANEKYLLPDDVNLWKVFRNRGTDLEHVAAVFDASDQAITDNLKKLANGDTVELKGLFRVFTVNRQQKYFIFVKAAK